MKNYELYEKTRNWAVKFTEKIYKIGFSHTQIIEKETFYKGIYCIL